MADKSNLVWKGRKCIFGLPISFTRYELTDSTLYVSKGFFNRETDQLLLYRVLDIKYNISFIGRILGVGTITLFCADSTDKNLKLEKIKTSRNVWELISKNVEEERKKAGIRGKEIYGVGEDHN